MGKSLLLIGIYILVTFGFVAWAVGHIGKDILPATKTGQFQVRIRAPQGSRLEYTEKTMLQVQDLLYKEVGRENVEITSTFAGQHPSSFPTLPIIMFSTAPNKITNQLPFTPTSKPTIQ